MLTYVLENSSIAIYEQLYRNLKQDIIEGVLQPGVKLPSKRTFAKNNGISTITIQNAYDQLISEGYIYTIPKKGYYVAKINEITKFTKETAISFDIKKPKETEQFAIDLSSNHMNPDNFPFSVWARVSRNVISNRSKELMEVPPSNGILELRSAISEHLKSFRGMLVDPNQIVIGAGTEYLYGLLIQLLGDEKIYCIENPGYKKLMQIYKKHKVTCKYSDMDKMGISIEELYKSGADIAHISPNHHFPTGITMPANRRYEVLAWANEDENRYIIEDDYDSEFRANGRPTPTLFSIDAFEKVIYMNTFSKSLSPTIRISYMVLPVHLINRYYEQLYFYSCTVSNFEQYTLAEFISKGYFEKHINRMRLYYSRKRKQFIESIEKSKLSNICEIMENESGLHFLIKLNTNLPEQVIVDRIRDKGIRIRALSEYFFTYDLQKECYFIINYSNIESNMLEEILDKIYECVKNNS